MLRTVGLDNILISVLCLGQEWYVVYQLVRKVHPFRLRGIWGIVVFVLSGFFFVFCACWRFWGWLFTSWCVQNLGLVGVPFLGSRPLGVDQLGYYLLDHWEESTAVHNTTFIVCWNGVYFRWLFSLVGSRIC